MGMLSELLESFLPLRLSVITPAQPPVFLGVELLGVSLPRFLQVPSRLANLRLHFGMFALRLLVEVAELLLKFAAFLYGLQPLVVFLLLRVSFGWLDDHRLNRLRSCFPSLFALFLSLLLPLLPRILLVFFDRLALLFLRCLSLSALLFFALPTFLLLPLPFALFTLLSLFLLSLSLVFLFLSAFLLLPLPFALFTLLSLFLLLLSLAFLFLPALVLVLLFSLLFALPSLLLVIPVFIALVLLVC
jgi:hypothetical protein